MDTTEKIENELADCLKSISSTGLTNMDSQIIEKLNSISAAATGMGMDQGKKLTDNLSAVLKNFKEGKASEDSVALRITAMEFYLKKTQGSDTEEL